MSGAMLPENESMYNNNSHWSDVVHMVAESTYEASMSTLSSLFHSAVTSLIEISVVLV